MDVCDGGFNPRASAETNGTNKPYVRDQLTFQLDEGELIDGASQRLVVQGEIQQGETRDLLHPLGATPGTGGGRRPHRQHAADLQESRAVGLLERLDAEGEQRGGRLQVRGASRHLVPQRANPGLSGLPGSLDQPRLPRLQETHQVRHPILHLLLQGDALLLRTANSASL